jgi:hypothetical protein
MAYTPQIWVDDVTVVTAARMNYMENGIAGAGSAGGIAPAVKLYKTAAQSIPNNAATVVNFEAEFFDSDSIHDPANPSRLTCRTAGRYLVFGLCAFPTNATGDRFWQLMKNGTVIQYFSGKSPSGAVSSFQPGMTLLELEVNDYLQFGAFQQSGGALTLMTGATTGTEFGMIYQGGK